MAAHSQSSTRDVFCNFPFDPRYEHLCLALISALVGTGQNPRTVLEIPPAADRLERILALLSQCAYSVHDLSRVQLSAGPFRVPRFNMAFELGLAVSIAKRPPNRHQFRLLEERPFRLQHSLSDLNGYDPYVHYGTPNGMFAAICDVFTDFRPFPLSEAWQFRKVYLALRAFRRRRFGTASAYSSDKFKLILVAAREYVRECSS